MNTSKNNYTKIRLDRYVEKIRNGQLNSLPLEDVGYEVLRLLFAYRRHEHGLHLRWHQAESNYLALLTVQELKDAKKRDPILNGIYEAILLKADGNEAQVQKLLETAETRINEISSSQSARASTPRKLNPLLQRAEIHRKRNKGITPGEIIERLKDDVGSHGIIDYGDDIFVYEEPTGSGIEKSMGINSVRNAIRKLTNGARKYRNTS